MSDLPLSDLHRLCSRHFRYVDLIQCGETWHRLATEAGDRRIAANLNVPHETATWEAIARLATTVLDPLVEEFGLLELTYGFAGPSLTRHIKSRIAPGLDQHAGSELNRSGNLICKRRGMACDLRVAGTDSLRVARFVAERLPFDRVYLYGADRPLHVSVGPEAARAIVEMRHGPSGRLIPRAFSWDRWLVLSAGN